MLSIRSYSGLGSNLAYSGGDCTAAEDSDGMVATASDKRTPLVGLSGDEDGGAVVTLSPNGTRLVELTSFGGNGTVVTFKADGRMRAFPE